MRRFSTRAWVAAGSVVALVAVVAVAAVLSSGGKPADEVLGVQILRSTTSSITSTVEASPPASPAAGPVTAGPTSTLASNPAPVPAPAPATGSIAGTVTRDGSPLSGAIVKVALAGGSERTTTTDADGHYVLADVPAGNHQVQVVDPGDGSSCDAQGNCVGRPSQTANRSVDVTAGHESRLDVNFT